MKQPSWIILMISLFVLAMQPQAVTAEDEVQSYEQSEEGYIDDATEAEISEPEGAVEDDAAPEEEYGEPEAY